MKAKKRVLKKVEPPHEQLSNNVRKSSVPKININWEKHRNQSRESENSIERKPEVFKGNIDWAKKKKPQEQTVAEYRRANSHFDFRPTWTEKKTRNTFGLIPEEEEEQVDEGGRVFRTNQLMPVRHSVVLASSSQRERLSYHSNYSQSSNFQMSKTKQSAADV